MTPVLTKPSLYACTALCKVCVYKRRRDVQPVMPFLDEHQAVLPFGKSQHRTGSKEGVQHH